jgi:hypothetical protein
MVSEISSLSVVEPPTRVISGWPQGSERGSLDSLQPPTPTAMCLTRVRGAANEDVAMLLDPKALPHFYNGGFRSSLHPQHSDWNPLQQPAKARHVADL